MPKLVTLLRILREGSRKGSIFRSGSANSDALLPLLRDHYDRLDLFLQKRYPKEKRTYFDAEIVKLAVCADRDSSLGIIDTVTREFITLWLPELEGFIGEEHEDEKTVYTQLANGVEESIIITVDRVDCSDDENALNLRESLVKLVVSHLTDLYNTCRSLLDDSEKSRFNPKTYMRKRMPKSDGDIPILTGNATNPRSRMEKKAANSRTSKSIDASSTTKIVEPMSEARLLNSAIAWDVVDSSENISPTPVSMHKATGKRGFSEAFFDDGPDPTDNGEVWDTYKVAKRQKFEIKVSNIISVSDSEDDDFDLPKSPNEPRRMLKPVSRNGKQKKNIGKSNATSSKAIGAQVDLQIPGALKASDENCTLM